MIEGGVLVCLTVWGTVTWTPLPEVVTSATQLTEHVPYQRQFIIRDSIPLQFTSVSTAEGKVFAAAHQTKSVYNWIKVIYEDDRVEQIELVKKYASFNPITMQRVITREEGQSYLLCSCAFNMLYLFSVTPKGLRLLEQVDVDSNECQTAINGFKLNSNESRVFAFGNFNFQSTYKLRV